MNLKSLLMIGGIGGLGGVALGAGAFILLAATGPVAIIVGVITGVVILAGGLISGVIVESELKREIDEKNAQNQEKWEKLQAANRSEVATNENIIREKIESNKLNDINVDVQVLKKTVNSLNIKLEQQNEQNQHTFDSIQSTVHDLQQNVGLSPLQNVSGNNASLKEEKSQNETKIEISTEKQSTALHKHGLFASANEEQINQTPPIVDTPDNSKKRPELRNR